MKHLILHDGEALQSLTQRATRAAAAHAMIIGEARGGSLIVSGIAWWWGALRGERPTLGVEPDADTMGGEEAARQVLVHLVDPVERQLPEFWASPLGRIVAWWTGGEEEEFQGVVLGVPVSHAAAALGMSRQGVHDAVKRGKLESYGKGLGVSAVSLSRYMRERYPLDVAGQHIAVQPVPPCGDPRPHDRHLKGPISCPGVPRG